MTLADILIPLAGSISNEKALKMREACDLLESRVDINQRGTNHAHDLISLLTDRVKELERDNLDRRLTKLERAVDVLDRQRVETLNLRVNGLEHVDRIARLDAEVAQLDRNLQAEVVARVKAHCTCTHEKRMHANALNGCLVSGCRCEKYTGEGRAEEARSGSVTGPSKQPVQARPTGVREDVSVVDEGPVASRQAAPSPAPSVPFGGVTPEALAHARKVIADHDAVYGSEISDAMRGLPVPAPATGKVPEWVGVLAKLNDAHEIVCKVASDRREWRMSIPVRDTDTDMMLSDAINAAENCIRRLIASRAPAQPRWGPRDEGDDEKCEGGEDPHGASAKNTGEGEVEHAASVSRSVSAKDASRATTPNNAEEGASAMRHGSGARPDATSLSTACPLCHGMLSEDECKKQNTPSPQGSTASAERSVRVDVVHANDGTPLMAAAHVAQPLTGGEGVPAWVPSVKELDTLWMREALKLRGQDSVDSAWNWIRRLIASRYVEWRAAHLVEEPGFDKGWDAAKRRFDERAPRASTVSVEEMAERLLNAQLKHYGLSPRAWAQVDEEERAYWLALARAALAPTNTPAASGGRDGVE